MRLGWGHDDGAFFFSRPDAAQQECCEPGFTLLCMGLFSRFFVQALPCTAEGAVCRVLDTRSLVPRAYGTNRSSSNTSCSRNRKIPYAIALPACGKVTELLGRLLRYQGFQLFHVLDVHLDATGHHDVAGLLVGLAGP